MRLDFRMKSIKTKLIYAVIPSIELMTIEIEHMKNQHYDAYMMHIIQAIYTYAVKFPQRIQTIEKTKILVEKERNLNEFQFSIVRSCIASTSDNELFIRFAKNA